MSIFEVVETSHDIHLDENREASLAFTVNNQSQDDLRAEVRVLAAVPEPPEKAPENWLTWFSLDGEAVRAFGPRGRQTYQVHIKVPADAPPGKYGIQTLVRSERNPDREKAYGQRVEITVPAAVPVEQKQPNLWWIPIAAAAAVVVLGLATWLFWPTSGVPSIVGMTPDQADLKLEEANLRVVQAGFLEEAASDVAAGAIAEQDPPAGDPIPESREIRVLLQPLVVPNLFGLSQSDAETALSEKLSGATVVVVGTLVTKAEPGTVVTQKPPPLAVVTEVPKQVEVFVEAPLMPELKGKTFADGVSLLNEKVPGIQFDRVNQEVTQSEIGKIVDQRPAKGESVGSGTAVTLQVGVKKQSPPSPRVYKSGTLDVTALSSWDLDIGTATTTDTDLFLGTGPAAKIKTAFGIKIPSPSLTARILVPQTGASFAVMSEAGAPGYEGCSKAKLSTNQIDLAPLKTGTYLCAKTNRNRYAQLHLTQKAVGKYRFSFTTWEVPRQLYQLSRDRVLFQRRGVDSPAKLSEEDIEKLRVLSN